MTELLHLHLRPEGHGSAVSTRRSATSAARTVADWENLLPELRAQGRYHVETY